MQRHSPKSTRHHPYLEFRPKVLERYLENRRAWLRRERALLRGKQRKKPETSPTLKIEESARQEEPTQQEGCDFLVPDSNFALLSGYFE